MSGNGHNASAAVTLLEQRPEKNFRALSGIRTHDLYDAGAVLSHREESWKYDAQRSIFDEIRETLPRVFDTSFQTKQKLRSKRRT